VLKEFIRNFKTQPEGGDLDDHIKGRPAGLRARHLAAVAVEQIATAVPMPLPETGVNISAVNGHIQSELPSDQG
jgi:hypothetical protein